MTVYGGILLCGILGTFALYTWRLKAHRQPIVQAFFALLFSAALGAILAKVGYCVLLADTELFDYGLESLISFYPYEFSVFCGGGGVLLGVWLAAKVSKQPIVTSLDLFAPLGALLLCVVRIGESQLGTIGAGPLIVEGSLFARSPLGMPNSYGEWHLSVWFFEAVFALVVAVLFLIRKINAPKKTLEWTLFYLALPQVFWESLRARCMKWGFVRVEQLLCGLLLLGLVFLACKRNSSNLKAIRKYIPVLGMIGCILVIVGVEFALDKSPISTPVCYSIMILSLLCMAWLETLSWKRVPHT